MRTWAKGTSRAVALTASFVALGATALPANAFADVTNGDGGVLSGNQLNLPISAPVDASGNGVAVAGTATGTSRGGSSVTGGGGGGQRTSGDNGLVSGNQVNAPVSAPVNACGNGVGVLGDAHASCVNGARVDGGSGSGGGQVTSGANGTVAGNQVNAPISAPVDACGNAVAVAGTAVAGCEGGALVKNGGPTGAGQTTSGVSSTAGGNQLNVPVSAPANVCGNAVGNALAGCEGGASVRNGGHLSGDQITNGDSSVIGGSQANAPISLPVTACGDAGAVLGEAGAFCEGGAHVRSSSGGDQQTSGKAGILAGSQGNTPVGTPVEACGDAAAVAGTAAAACTAGQTLVAGSHGSGGQSSGDAGVGGGNQQNVPVTDPIDPCGNAVAVVGHSDPQCEGGHGGYHPYYRTAGPDAPGSAPRPVTLGKPVPVDPGAALAVPSRLLSPGEVGAPGQLPRSNNVPAVRTLPGAETAAGTDALRQGEARPSTGVPAPMSIAPDGSGLPGGSGGLPKAQGLPKGLPKAQGLPKGKGLSTGKGLPKGKGLPQGLPAAGGMPGMRQMSDGAGPLGQTLPGAKSVGQVPGLGDLAKALAVPPGAGHGTAALSDLGHVAGAHGVDAVSGLVRLPGVANGRALPGTPVVPAPSTRAHGGPSGGVAGLDLTNVVETPRDVSVLPVSSDVHAPEANGQVGPMRTVAAEKPIIADAETGSLWVLGAATMLAAVSGALALTRRVRLGGRR
ncbi:chaplin family protein [Actinomadura terrae]|uniref:chaplin family protein n=1 Tax=Actinomadura terrae TaxID=604353 RepID=UPI001FA6EAA9|nr:chaplin family protein [Actinomadura terrae]